jgi:hypothetical protein
MKKKSLLWIVLVGLSLNFLSCSKDEEGLSSNQKNDFENERLKYARNAIDESIKNDFELRAGILHFKNQESYLKVKNSFVKSNMDERIKFAEKLGFESLLSVTQKAIDDINDSKTKEEFELLSVKYQDFVNNDNGIISSKVTDGYEAALTNKEGIVFIGKMIYKFTPNLEYIIFDGDKTKLNFVKSGRTSESAEVYIFNKQSRKSTSSKECISLRGEAQTCCRRAIVTANFTALNTYYNGPDNYTLEAIAYIVGTPYTKSFWGGWPNYRTVNTLNISNARINIYSAGALPLASNTYSFSYSNDWTGIDFGASAYAQNIQQYYAANAYARLDDDAIVVPYVPGFINYSHQGMGGVVVEAVCP